jgi:serine/threonine protein kinase
MIANTEGDDPRLGELLSRWEELREQGRSISAEECCSTCPELAEELARRIALLRPLDRIPDGTRTVEADGTPPAPAGTPGRQLATARADFRDLRFHAAGALGEVFMARNAELNRDVALKFIKSERSRDPDSLRRFLLEAEVTGRLEHPGVVPIYALGSDASGSPCYAMRFIRGETLQDAIDAFHAAEKLGRDPSERAMALRELLTRFVSICSTMAYAHSRGILHRDLKPRNVMLGKYDETLVVDWGLAKTFDRDDVARSGGEETLMPSSGDIGSDTPTVGVVGTPAYMSPEQAQARWDIVGLASDVFSLGGILYTILTGRPPYQGRKVGEILEKVKHCEFPAPRQIKPSVPRALEAICLKAMAKRPEDRYATASDLAEDVRRWLADQPVSAWREPLFTRVRRWGRRHKVLVAIVAACLVTSATFLGLGAFRAERQASLIDNYEETARTLLEVLEVIAENEGPDSEASRPKARPLSVRGVIIAPGRGSGVEAIPSNTATLRGDALPPPLVANPVDVPPPSLVPPSAPSLSDGSRPGSGPAIGSTSALEAGRRPQILRDRYQSIKNRLKSEGRDRTIERIEQIVRRYNSETRAQLNGLGGNFGAGAQASFTPNMIGD